MHAFMVRLFVAINDRDWFDALSRRAPNEVNFWQHSGRTAFRALRAGELLLFKLHAPDNFIVDGGVFSYGSLASLSPAWAAFGVNNGTASLAEVRQRIARYRREPSPSDPRSDTVIGCRILTQPLFWSPAQWLPVPASLARSIIQGKGYSTDELDGRTLWDAVSERLADMPAPPSRSGIDLPRHGVPILVRPCLGQGTFRLMVTDGYERRCAVTGGKTLPILDAAHIRAFADGGAHDPKNSLLLRADIHRLFDLGYVTVSPDYRFEVSARLKTDYDNGRHYYDLHVRPVRQPRADTARPAPEALHWHRERRYLG